MQTPDLSQEQIDAELYIPDDKEIADSDATKIDAYHSFVLLRYGLMAFFESEELSFLNAPESVGRLNKAFSSFGLPPMPVFVDDAEEDEDRYSLFNEALSDIEGQGDSFIYSDDDFPYDQ